MTPKCPDCKHDQDDCSCSETIESLRQQLADSQKQVILLRELTPKRIPNGFVSFGKYYSEQEDKFNDPYNKMAKFKSKYLSDCEKALSDTEPKP
jgi:hypothetical protein